MIGCGPVGLLALAGARCGGAAHIIATDVSEGRLELARAMGADMAVHAEQESVTVVVRESTSDDGIDHVIEASGSAEALEQSFGYLKKGGKVSILGNPKRPVQLDVMPMLIHKEAKVTGFHGRRMFDTWEKAEAMVASGRLDVERVITHELPLSRFKEGFEFAMSGRSGKVVFVP